MTALSHPASQVELAGATQSEQRPAIFSGAAAVGLASGFARDWRFVAESVGTITDSARVMLKSDASAPEVPMRGARVRLHRILDGYCAWEGLSDANGYYWPRGLEVGVAYYPVAIDLTGTHKCEAAGPVIAVRES